MSFSDYPSSIQLSRSSARSFHTVLVIVHLAQASCLACCLVSGLPYKLVVLWESSVITGQRKSFTVNLKGSWRVQLASWRNLILTFQTFDLIGRFIHQSGGFVRLIWSSVRCSIGASLGSLNLIWFGNRPISRLWFGLIRCSMFNLIDPVELI